MSKDDVRRKEPAAEITQDLHLHGPSRLPVLAPSDQPVTAEAMRYSIERALSPGLGSATPGPQVIADIAGERAFRRGRARHISGLRASGNRLTITLVRPSHDFLERLSLPFFAAVPAGTPIVAEGLDPPRRRPGRTTWRSGTWACT